MKIRLLILGCICFFSCKITKDYIAEGSYYKKGKDYIYSLTLAKDSTFILSIKYFEVNSKCKGKWNYKSKDTILLTCDEENITSQLASGYMNERKQKLIIISNKKVKIDNTILIKQ